MTEDSNSGGSISKRGRGRPKKAEIAAKKKGNRGKRGRPPGDAAIINEYKARMLASPQSAAVLQTIFDVATDPDHKNWPAATKMVMDRILPASYFEKDKQTGGRPSIEISITGLSAAVSTPAAPDDDITDVEYSTVGGDDA